MDNTPNSKWLKLSFYKAQCEWELENIMNVVESNSIAWPLHSLLFISSAPILVIGLRSMLTLEYSFLLTTKFYVKINSYKNIKSSTKWIFKWDLKLLCKIIKFMTHQNFTKCWDINLQGCIMIKIASQCAQYSIL